MSAMNKLFAIPAFALLAACGNKSDAFKHDLDFLKKYDTGLVLLRTGDEEVIVSPKYQGKVFTSSAAGDGGASFGWVHYKAFSTTDTHINAYGGEDRLWLGPEGGRFSLFFHPGAKMEFANWKTPAAFDTEPWQIASRSDSAVALKKEMALENYAGTPLQLRVDRTITILSNDRIASILGIQTADVEAVGYSTINTLTNTGQIAWTDSTGMPCLWLLDMFNPSPTTTIVVPYTTAAGDSGKPATTDYFGEIASDRIQFIDGTLFFKADGNSRGKLGIHPTRAKPVAGSYDAAQHVLTIISFDVDPQARYLNQEWNTVKPPFSGDAVNSYNDGPLAGGGQMGPFYELESVSPAAALTPGQALAHHHAVFHFTGNEEQLDAISRKLLGVSIERIKTAFP
jgi:hypothetical protein